MCLFLILILADFLNKIYFLCNPFSDLTHLFTLQTKKQFTDLNQVVIHHFLCGDDPHP